jgi:AraC-like DNA-binding protein
LSKCKNLNFFCNLVMNLCINRQVDILKIVLLLGPVYVSLFWAFILCSYSTKKSIPKHLLGWFMIAAFFLYLSHFFYFVQEYQIYYYMDSLYTCVYLMVYPIFHIYVRLLTVDNVVSFKKYGVHIVAPALIFLLTLAGYIIMDKQQGLIYVTTVLKGGTPILKVHTYMNAIFLLGRAVFLIQVILYLYLNFKLLQTNHQKLQDYYSNIENIKLTWVQFFNITLAFTSLSSISLVFLGREIFLVHEYYLFFPSVMFTIMLFIIGYLGNSQYSTFFIAERVQEFKAEDPHPIVLKERLIKLFEKEKVYKNPNLKIWDICYILGTNRTYVSKVINNNYGMNFCGLVNHYRVGHAKIAIQNNKSLTNAEVAEESGFGSLSSLYRAFQEVENLSLGQFRKQEEDKKNLELEKELSDRKSHPELATPKR